MTFEHNLKNIEDEIAREIDLLFTYHQKREIELFGYWFLIQKEINNEVKLV